MGYGTWRFKNLFERCSGNFLAVLDDLLLSSQPILACHSPRISCNPRRTLPGPVVVNWDPLLCLGSSILQQRQDVLGVQGLREGASIVEHWTVLSSSFLARSTSPFINSIA